MWCSKPSGSRDDERVALVAPIGTGRRRQVARGRRRASTTAAAATRCAPRRAARRARARASTARSRRPASPGRRPARAPRARTGAHSARPPRARRPRSGTRGRSSEASARDWIQYPALQSPSRTVLTDHPRGEYCIHSRSPDRSPVRDGKGGCIWPAMHRPPRRSSARRTSPRSTPSRRRSPSAPCSRPRSSSGSSRPAGPERPGTHRWRCSSPASACSPSAIVATRGGLFFVGTLFLGGGGIYLGLGILANGFWAATRRRRIQRARLVGVRHARARDRPRHELPGRQARAAGDAHLRSVLLHPDAVPGCRDHREGRRQR